MTATSAPKPRTSTVTDVRNVMVRELRPVLRDPISVIFSILQPLIFLGLFGPLLVAQSGDDVATTLGWFVPGVLVMIVLFGTGVTGSNLQGEMMTGSHERSLVAPLSRSSLLIGRALKEVAPIIVQASLVVAIALPFGYRANPVGLLVGLVLLAVFGIGLGSLSYALALATKDREWMFWGVQQSLIFPVLILSGVLLPLDGGPAWMRAVAAVNPVTHIVEAERALLTGSLSSGAVASGWVAALALAAVGLAVGVRAIRRSS